MLSTLVLSVVSLLFWPAIFVITFIDSGPEQRSLDLILRVTAFVISVAAAHTVYTMYWG